MVFPVDSGSRRAFSESTGAQLPQARNRQLVSELPPPSRRTTQASHTDYADYRGLLHAPHIQLSFESVVMAQVRASAVCESLGAIFASKRKLKLVQLQIPEAPATSDTRPDGSYELFAMHFVHVV